MKKVKLAVRALVLCSAFMTSGCIVAPLAMIGPADLALMAISTTVTASVKGFVSDDDDAAPSGGGISVDEMLANARGAKASDEAVELPDSVLAVEPAATTAPASPSGGGISVDQMLANALDAAAADRANKGIETVAEAEPAAPAAQNSAISLAELKQQIASRELPKNSAKACE